MYINYGPHDNLAMLKEYGFVLSQNCYNFVLLDHEVWQLFDEMETKRGLDVKKQILEGAGYSGDYSIKTEEISFRLMAALRLLALNGATEPGFDRRVMEWHDVVMGQTDMISTENERKALIMLQSICNRVAKQTEKEIETLSVSGHWQHRINIRLISSCTQTAYHRKASRGRISSFCIVFPATNLERIK